MKQNDSALSFQREGAISNAHVGRDFEAIAMEVLQSHGLQLHHDHGVAVGIGKEKKNHAFDLGSDDPKTIVECKSHKCTAGNNVPSAKMTVWNEAMYYFAVAPPTYRKIFFVLKDARKSNQETLAEHYVRTYRHLIPSDVEIWEYDADSSNVEILTKSLTQEGAA